MAYIDAADLEPFADIDEAKADAMIADAVAQAIVVAPCLANEDTLTANQKAAVLAVLRTAVLRWNETGSGALQQQSIGPAAITVDTRQQRRSLFWPSEIEQLHTICATIAGRFSGAFTVPQAARRGGVLGGGQVW